LNFLKKALIVAASVIVFYFSAISLISIYYKKEIENRVVSEINENLLKPIKIGHISISAFTNFPYISFSLNEVVLLKSDTSQIPLLKLEKLKILFSPYNIFIKNFKVNEILIANGFIDARVDSLGNKDFDIIQKKDTTKTNIDSESISSFDIRNIKFKNIRIFYENKFKPKRVDLTFSNTETDLNLVDRKLSGELIGMLYSKEVTLRPGTLFKDSNLKVDFKFSFDMKAKLFSFTDCILMSGENSYMGNGTIDFRKNSFLTLNVTTKDADIQNMFSLIADRWTKKIKPLNLTGKISANGLIKVSLLPGNQPDFSIDFTTESLQIHNEKVNADIHQVRFSGNLNSNNSIEMEDYSIDFKDFSAKINSIDFIRSKEVFVRNFKDPSLKTNLLLSVSGRTLFDLLKFKEYSEITGKIALDITYDGKLNYLLGNKCETPEMYGNVELNHLKLKLNKLDFPFEDIYGKINFTKDVVKMDKLEVKSGKSDLSLTGTAKNLFNSVFNDTTGLEMNINFVSQKFYFDDFNSSEKSKKLDTKKKNIFVHKGTFVLPYGLKATLKGTVQNFHARNYHGNNIVLDMEMNKKKVVITESMNSFGGSLELISNFSPVGNEIHCYTNIRMHKFELDKVFNDFNNFKQKSLTSSNVKGIVSGTINSFFKFSSTLELDTNSIVGYGNFDINRLELIKVEPLMILGKIGFDEKDLKRVTFDKITTSFTMKNGVIEIPRTLFVTNILYFYLDVVVQPDGETEYYMLLPVKNLKKKPNTEGLTNDSKAGLSIPIRIKGKAGKLKLL
jgi:hypothetical protein